MNERSLVIRGLVLLVITTLIIKLFTLQVGNEDYKLAAQDNIVREIIEYPFRGSMYDRNGVLIAHNDPIFNLYVIPKEVKLEDSTRVTDLFNLDPGEFLKRLNKARAYSPVRLSVFEEKLSPETFATVSDVLNDLRGFYVQTRTNRSYQHASLSNALGYVGEISARRLNQDSTDYYRSGDYIGISGLESKFEACLRGKRGISYKMVNARGTIQGDFKGGQFDTLPIPGEDLHLTIDLELQQYAEKLLAGKVGSAVAIEPSTGEILVFVSSPSYDPSQLTGRFFSDNFKELQQDSLKPLFNRPIQAMYPPGSMFKTLQSLIALQEDVVTSKERIYSDHSLIGDLAPKGYYDVPKAITYSSNNYFYKVFRRVILQGHDKNQYMDSRIGLENWKRYANQFGLGVKLGIDLPGEKSGFIPGIERYDRIYGTNRWKFSNIYSLSIGQGELLVTPLQMANLGAILANRGYYYTPHLAYKVGTDSLLSAEKVELTIEDRHFDPVIEGMQKVVKLGSGIRAFIPDIEVCGKTSTVQNPPYPDHSGFMGFAPKSNPQIAIAVYVENAGQGGRAAASTASLLMEKYIRGSITRPWLEDYVLKGNFFNARRKTSETN